MSGCAPWLGLALLQFVDRSLRQTNPPAEFALAPAKHCPRQPYLGRKGPPVSAQNLLELLERVLSCVAISRPELAE